MENYATIENLPRDILFELLFEVNDPGLVHMGQVNKMFDSLCRDEIFWLKRGKKRFGDMFQQLNDAIILKNNAFISKNDLSLKKTYQVASELDLQKTSLVGFEIKVKDILELYYIKNLDLSYNYIE